MVLLVYTKSPEDQKLKKRFAYFLHKQESRICLVAQNYSKAVHSRLFINKAFDYNIMNQHNFFIKLLDTGTTFNPIRLPPSVGSPAPFFATRYPSTSDDLSAAADSKNSPMNPVMCIYCASFGEYCKPRLDLNCKFRPLNSQSLTVTYSMRRKPCWKNWSKSGKGYSYRLHGSLSPATSIPWAHPTKKQHQLSRNSNF